jgi:hypothetical protein
MDMKKVALLMFALPVLVSCQDLIQPIAFKEYRNTVHQISFSYPENWTIYDFLTEKGYVEFISPTTQECLTRGNCSAGGPYNDMVISYNMDINDFLGGANWMGRRHYENLEDFMSEPPSEYALVQKTGEIRIAGQKGYEISVDPADEYGILVERDGGIYFIHMPSLHLNAPDALAAKKKIISSFKFLD